jgi:hypothetical protein
VFDVHDGPQGKVSNTPCQLRAIFVKQKSEAPMISAPDGENQQIRDETSFGEHFPAVLAQLHPSVSRSVCLHVSDPGVEIDAAQ